MGAYNLDFLDNLDDPNFNPFETKSKVRVAFGESNDTEGTNNIEDVRQETEPPVKKTPTARRKVATASKKKVANQNKEGKDSESKDEKPKKVMPPKPWLMKKSLKLKNAGEQQSVTNDINIDIILPPAPDKKGMTHFPYTY